MAEFQAFGQAVTMSPDTGAPFEQTGVSQTQPFKFKAFGQTGVVSPPLGVKPDPKSASGFISDPKSVVPPPAAPKNANDRLANLLAFAEQQAFHGAPMTAILAELREIVAMGKAKPPITPASGLYGMPPATTGVSAPKKA